MQSILLPNSHTMLLIACNHCPYSAQLVLEIVSRIGTQLASRGVVDAGRQQLDRGRMANSKQSMTAKKRRQLRSGCRRVVDEGRPACANCYPRDRLELDTSLGESRQCRRYLEQLRWPRGFQCPECGDTSEPWRTSTGLIACRACRHGVMLERGTIFQRPSAPLSRWFRVLWEVADGEACMSVEQVRQTLRLATDQAAAGCLASIRDTMGLAEGRPLGGVVELGRACLELPGMVLEESSLQKGLVAIAVERAGAAGQLGETGPLRIQHLAGRDTRDGLAFASRAIEPGSEVHTLAWDGYARLADAGFKHRIRRPEHAGASGVDHVASLLELWLWTQPDVDWNSLQAHFDEFTFRFNHRSEPSGSIFQRLVVTALQHGDAKVAAAVRELLRSA